MDVKLCVEQMEGVLANREPLYRQPQSHLQRGRITPHPHAPSKSTLQSPQGVAQRPTMKFKAVPTSTLYQAQSTGTFRLQLPGVPGPGKAKQLVPSILVRR